jgi:hypothetical protein
MQGHYGYLGIPAIQRRFPKAKYPLQFRGAAGDIYVILKVCQQGRHKFHFEVNQALFSVTP